MTGGIGMNLATQVIEVQRLQTAIPDTTPTEIDAPEALAGMAGGFPVIPAVKRSSCPTAPVSLAGPVGESKGCAYAVIWSR